MYTTWPSAGSPAFKGLESLYISSVTDVERKLLSTKVVFTYTPIYTTIQTDIEWRMFNFELLLFTQNSSCVAQILHGLSYEV